MMLKSLNLHKENACILIVDSLNKSILLNDGFDLELVNFILISENNNLENARKELILYTKKKKEKEASIREINRILST